MFDVFYAECLKLKRSKMLWLVVIGAFLPALLNLFIALHNLEAKPFVPFKDLFNNNLLMMTMLMCPTLFALFAGYIFGREYQERTINSFLTVPHSRILLLLGKYAVMLPVMFATLALSFALTVLTGFLIRHDALTGGVLGDAAAKYLLLLVLEYALISAAATVSIVGKGYIPAMGLGVFAVISELTIMQSKYIMDYPWSAPLNMILHVSPKNDHFSVGAMVLAIAFVIPLLFNILYYLKADVHSG